MENINKIEERLWDFIDGSSSPAEKENIMRLLETNPIWQKAYADLMNMQTLLGDNSLEEPSMRFSKNVMEEIAKHSIAPSTKSYVNKKIIYGIGGFFLILIGGMLAFLFSQIDFSQQGSINIPSGLPKLKTDWLFPGNSTILNIFLIIDAVLGLFLADKFLQNRKDKLKAKSV